ncbi:hypothetical protein SDC9_163609 [bioreactor metagenome]|uniref:Uncharacterized protein n=1 Tax=bioreactor metagenome TaxID=1076179 RepID=A0A645FPC2_9ZZZZ
MENESEPIVSTAASPVYSCAMALLLAALSVSASSMAALVMRMALESSMVTASMIIVKRQTLITVSRSISPFLLFNTRLSLIRKPLMRKQPPFSGGGDFKRRAACTAVLEQRAGK